MERMPMENKGKKVVKVPEAGQWPDKVALPALIAGTVLTTAGFLMAFLYAAPVNGAALNAPVLVSSVSDYHSSLKEDSLVITSYGFSNLERKDPEGEQEQQAVST